MSGGWGRKSECFGSIFNETLNDCVCRVNKELLKRGEGKEKYSVEPAINKHSSCAAELVFRKNLILKTSVRRKIVKQKILNFHPWMIPAWIKRRHICEIFSVYNSPTTRKSKSWKTYRPILMSCLNGISYGFLVINMTSMTLRWVSIFFRYLNSFDKSTWLADAWELFRFV